MRKRKYENLKEQYPEFISLDQLRCICGIAKRSALYLIEHEIIPAVDTGKRTWRYRIAIDDVITYLRRREQVGSMIPPGRVSSRALSAIPRRKSYAQLVPEGASPQLAAYFAYLYADAPDTIDANEASELTGLSDRTILHHIRAGDIQALRVAGRFVIPKASLLRFVTSPTYIDIKSNADSFRRIVGGFEIWRAAYRAEPLQD